MTKQEISNIQIDLSKVNANGSKYFELFDRHIPKLTSDAVVLIYDISNLDCIVRIIQKNPSARYVIYGNKYVNEALDILNDNKWNIECFESYNIFNIDMKFDCVIMNPPYQRNLHLKILAEAIKHLKDDDSVCVNLSPILWIEDPHAHKKEKSNLFKFKNSILNKCESIDIIDRFKSNELFGIGLFSNLGIYTCKHKSNKHINGETFWEYGFADWEINVFNKIYNLPMHLSDKCESNKRDGIRVLIACIAGNRGTLPIYKDLSYVIDGMKNGLDWTKCKNNGGYEKEEGIGIPLSIKFNTEIEAENFYNSWKTNFLKWISKRFLFDQHIPLQFLPYMNDYTHPWTDEDFYKFFNITEDEQKIIEETMAKYK